MFEPTTAHVGNREQTPNCSRKLLKALKTPADHGAGTVRMDPDGLERSRYFRWKRAVAMIRREGLETFQDLLSLAISHAFQMQLQRIALNIIVSSIRTRIPSWTSFCRSAPFPISTAPLVCLQTLRNWFPSQPPACLASKSQV